MTAQKFGMVLLQLVGNYGNYLSKGKFPKFLKLTFDDDEQFFNRHYLRFQEGEYHMIYIIKKYTLSEF